MTASARVETWHLPCTMPTCCWEVRRGQDESGNVIKKSQERRARAAEVAGVIEESEALWL